MTSARYHIVGCERCNHRTTISVIPEACDKLESIMKKLEGLLASPAGKSLVDRLCFQTQLGCLLWRVREDYQQLSVSLCQDCQEELEIKRLHLESLAESRLGEV